VQPQATRHDEWSFAAVAIVLTAFPLNTVALTPSELLPVKRQVHQAR
jgi:hypothetical protein